MGYYKANKEYLTDSGNGWDIMSQNNFKIFVIGLGK